MSSHDARPDRRRDLRVAPKGTVIVRVDSYLIRARIANLSRSGLVTRTRITPPERLLGAMVELSLRLDGVDAAWLELGGRISRIGASSIAFLLDIVPLSFVRLLDQAVERSRQHDRVLSVVLVDGIPGRRRAMAEGFRAEGCVVVDASTPLEAIIRLGESHFEPDLIAIADSLPVAISGELRRFVDAEHPHAMPVSIGDVAGAPDRLSHWLSATDRGGELAARIRDVLSRIRRPCSP